MQVKTAPYLRVVQSNDLTIIYHSLYGNPVTITPEVNILLSELTIPVSLEELSRKNSSYPNMLADLIQLGMVIQEDSPDQRVNWQKNKQKQYRQYELFFSGLVLVLTMECNFNCTYCVARSSGSFQGTMTWEIARKAIDTYLNYKKNLLPKSMDIPIIFTGGEPLLQFELIQKIVDYTRIHYPEERFRFRIISNGSLIKPDTANFLKSHEFEVIISLDGDEIYNDRTRRFISGAGTFQAIWRGLTELLKAGHNNISISSVYCSANRNGFHEGFFQKIAETKLQSLAINVNNLTIIEEPPVMLAQYFYKLRQQAGSLGINLSGLWSTPARNLRGANSEWALCSGAARSRLFILPDGAVPFCEYHHRMLGNIEDFAGLLSDLKKQPNSFLFGEWSRCRGCEIEGFCSPCVLEDELFHRENTAYQEAKCQFFRECTRLLLMEQ